MIEGRNPHCFCVGPALLRRRRRRRRRRYQTSSIRPQSQFSMAARCKSNLLLSKVKSFKSIFLKLMSSSWKVERWRARKRGRGKKRILSWRWSRSSWPLSAAVITCSVTDPARYGFLPQSVSDRCNSSVCVSNVFIQVNCINLNHFKLNWGWNEWSGFAQVPTLNSLSFESLKKIDLSLMNSI